MLPNQWRWFTLWVWCGLAWFVDNNFDFSARLILVFMGILTEFYPIFSFIFFWHLPILYANNCVLKQPNKKYTNKMRFLIFPCHKAGRSKIFFFFTTGRQHLESMSSCVFVVILLLTPNILNSILQFTWLM